MPLDRIDHIAFIVQDVEAVGAFLQEIGAPQAWSGHIQEVLSLGFSFGSVNVSILNEASYQWITKCPFSGNYGLLGCSFSSLLCLEEEIKELAEIGVAHSPITSTTTEACKVTKSTFQWRSVLFDSPPGIKVAGICEYILPIPCYGKECHPESPVQFRRLVLGVGEKDNLHPETEMGHIVSYWKELLGFQSDSDDSSLSECGFPSMKTTPVCVECDTAHVLVEANLTVEQARRGSKLIPGLRFL